MYALPNDVKIYQMICLMYVQSIVICWLIMQATKIMTLIVLFPIVSNECMIYTV